MSVESVAMGDVTVAYRIAHLARIDTASSDSGTDCVLAIVLAWIVISLAFVGRKNIHKNFTQHTNHAVEFELRQTETKYMAALRMLAC